MSGKDILIIGPGVLGSRVATLWKQRFPQAQITLKAKRQDPEREAKWQSLGFICGSDKDVGHKYPNVLFSAPPTAGTLEEYVDSVKAGGEICTSRYVFTSSGGVYVENDGGIVDEASDVVFSEDPSSMSSRAVGILQAEKKVLEHPGGIVLRLGGLYTLDRGAHNFWLSKVRESASAPNGLINLVHYDDAAEACVAAFSTEETMRKQEVFLVSDGQPLSRLEICKAAQQHQLYAGQPLPNFKGAADLMDGKRYNVAKARSGLQQWTPKFSDFSSFMAKDYVHQMKVPLLD